MIYLFINEPGIGLIDRTDHLDTSGRGGLSFNLQLNQRGSASVPLIIKSPWLDYRPVIGAPVYLYDVPAGGTAPTGPQIQTQPVLTSSGAAAVIGSGFAVWVQVTARASNSGDVRLGGDASVGISAGIPLSPGAAYFFPVISGSTYDLSGMWWYGALGDRIDVEWLDVGGSGYCVFAGTISDIETQWLSNTKDRAVRLTVSSLEQVFDSLIVDPVAFFDTSCGDIIRYLLYNVAIGVPVVAGDIANGPNVPSLIINFQRMSDIFSQLASIGGADYVWGVDPATSSLYFGPQSTTPAPMDFVTAMAKWRTFRHRETRADYRNREIVRMAQSALAPLVENFVGDGATTAFTLSSIVQQVLDATLPSSTSPSFATGSGSFGGLPVSAEFVNIGGVASSGSVPFTGGTTYAFVSALGYSPLFPTCVVVLIGASTGATAQNFTDAINQEPATLNFTYTNSAGPDPLVAATVVSSTVSLRARTAGAAGNSITLGSSAHFSWAGGSLSGGVDAPALDHLSVGSTSDGLYHQLYYTPGLEVVTLATAPASGKLLSISYYAVGGDVVIAQNNAEIAARAAIEHGTGKYDHIISDGSITVRDIAQTVAATTLDNWDAIPETWSVETDQPGYLPGQSVPVVVLSPEGIGDYIDGIWVCHEVSAALIPQLETAAFNGLTQDAPSEHFRYTITFMGSPIPSYINYWQQLGPAASV